MDGAGGPSLCAAASARSASRTSFTRSSCGPDTRPGSGRPSSRQMRRNSSPSGRYSRACRWFTVLMNRRARSSWPGAGSQWPTSSYMKPATDDRRFWRNRPVVFSGFRDRCRRSRPGARRAGPLRVQHQVPAHHHAVVAAVERARLQPGRPVGLRRALPLAQVLRPRLHDVALHHPARVVEVVPDAVPDGAVAAARPPQRLHRGGERDAVVRVDPPLRRHHHGPVVGVGHGGHLRLREVHRGHVTGRRAGQREAHREQVRGEHDHGRGEHRRAEAGDRGDDAQTSAPAAIASWNASV